VKDFGVIEKLKENNTSVAIVMGTIILSVIYIVRSAINPAVTVFSMTFKHPGNDPLTFFTNFLIIFIQIIVSAVTGFAGIYIALRLYMWLTKDLHEMEEIKNNNIAVGVVLAFVIFAVALLLEPGINTLLQSLIPLPSVNYRQIYR